MKIFSERSMNLIKLYSWNSVFFRYFKKSLIYILLPLIILSMLICYFVIRSGEESFVNNQSRAFFRQAPRWNLFLRI